MTGKELMYVEDALGHEQYFRTQCSQSAAGKGIQLFQAVLDGSAFREFFLIVVHARRNRIFNRTGKKYL